jgi:hypothetical protein
MQTSTSGGSKAPAIIAVVGGLLLAIGSFLSWATVSGGGDSVSASGTDGSDGYITLICGVIALAIGAAWFAKGAGKRALAILVLLAGLIGGGVGVYDAMTAKDSVLDGAAEELAPSFGVPADQVRVLLDQAIDAGQLSISLSIGLYMVIGGGLLALVGGVLGMRARGTEPAAATPVAGFEPTAAMAAPAEPPLGAEPVPPMPDTPPAPPADGDAGGQT